MPPSLPLRNYLKSGTGGFPRISLRALVPIFWFMIEARVGRFEKDKPILKLKVVVLKLVFLIILTVSSCTNYDVEKSSGQILHLLNIDNRTPIDSVLSRVASHFDIPGITAIVTNQDTLMEASAFGVANTASGIPLTLDHCFDINSISKSFCTLMIMQLVEENTLGLEDQLADLFPEIAETIHSDYRMVTVKDFIKHQSGLSRNGRHLSKSTRPHFTGNLKEQREQFTHWILNNESNNTVGEFSYSNAGYVIVGAIIEKVTDSIFEDEIKRRVFRPLDLTSPGFGWPVENAEKYAYGHSREWQKVNPVRYAPWYLYQMGNPAGGIHMSSYDLAAYSREQLSGLSGNSILLSQNGFETMHKVEGFCGLGWFNSVFPSFPGTEAGGTDDGYRSEIFISTELNISITVLTNINDQNDWLACKTIELALLRKYREYEHQSGS